MTPEHLYLHVPFCVRRCGYCDFAVTAMREPPVDAWLRAIEAELRQRLARYGWPTPLRLRTIYVGGGTPSLLGTGAMSRVRELLKRYASWEDDVVEWTAEANPESFTAELAADWRAAGVNRISLGAQTFHEPALRWMGRLHGPDGPARAVKEARSAGFDNISLDLMFGLPTRLGRDWPADLDRLLELQPEHVSLYGLTAEPATPLGRNVKSGRERLADEETYAAEFLAAAARLTQAEFRHYEVSNFARSGRESRHNGAYWRYRAYLGLGPGAHSFAAPDRWWNVRDWAAYQARMEKQETAEADRETLTAEQVALERTWLGLRVAEGLPLDTLDGGQRRVVEGWTGRGLAELSDAAVRLTAEGWLLLDRLAVELDDCRESAVDAMFAGAPHSW